MAEKACASEIDNRYNLQTRPYISLSLSRKAIKRNSIPISFSYFVHARVLLVCK